MEELQSTENLDREILEDARKKAFRILKTADETIQTQALEWEQKAAAALEALRQKYEKQRDESAREITARLPVEKRRVKAELTDKLLSRAVAHWYANLPRERVLAILSAELRERLCESGELRVTDAAAQPEPVRAFFSGISRAEADGILRVLLLNGQFSLEENKSGAAFAEMIVENNAVRIYASINKAVDFFMHRNRKELAEALLGSGFLDDEGAQSC